MRYYSLEVNDARGSIVTGKFQSLECASKRAQ
jgi:hypothetical protein